MQVPVAHWQPGFFLSWPTVISGLPAPFGNCKPQRIIYYICYIRIKTNDTFFIIPLLTIFSRYEKSSSIKPAPSAFNTISFFLWTKLPCFSNNYRRRGLSRAVCPLERYPGFNRWRDTADADQRENRLMEPGIGKQGISFQGLFPANRS